MNGRSTVECARHQPDTRRDRQPERERPARTPAASCCGLPHRARAPPRRSARAASTACANRSGSRRSTCADHAADRRGVPREQEEDDQDDDRSPPPRSARRPAGAGTPPGRDCASAGSAVSRKMREQHEHRRHVEHALEDDRRERRRGTQPLVLAPAGRAAAPRRRRAGSRKLAAKPMTVARKATAKRVGPRPAEQVLPAQRPERVGRASVVTSARPAAGPAGRASNLGPHLAQDRRPRRNQREQGDGQADRRRRSGGGRACQGKALYYKIARKSMTCGHLLAAAAHRPRLAARSACRHWCEAIRQPACRQLIRQAPPGLRRGSPWHCPRPLLSTSFPGLSPAPERQGPRPLRRRRATS